MSRPIATPTRLPRALSGVTGTLAGAFAAVSAGVLALIATPDAGAVQVHAPGLPAAPAGRFATPAEAKLLAFILNEPVGAISIKPATLAQVKSEVAPGRGEDYAVFLRESAQPDATVVRFAAPKGAIVGAGFVVFRASRIAAILVTAFA